MQLNQPSYAGSREEGVSQIYQILQETVFRVSRLKTVVALQVFLTF